MKKIIITFFIFNFLCFFGNVSAEDTNLEESENICYSLIKEYEKKDLKDFSFFGSGSTTNDGLIGVDFKGKDIFNKKSFVLGNTSKIYKTDLFRYYELLGLSNLDNFSESEINFYNILKGDKNEFLGCSYVSNEFLKGEISDFKKGDATVTYTTTPKSISLEEIEHNDIKWKIITTETFFKDRDGKEDTFKIYKKYFIPYNLNLEGYYNLYNLVDEYKETIDWYKLKMDNTNPNASYFKEVYNKDGIQIKRYFIGNKDTSDQYGIRYRFVNGHNFIDDFANFKKNKIFEYLVKENSELAEYIVVVLNSFDPITKEYTYPQLEVYAWVKFFLGEREIDKESIDIIPYYKAENQLAVNSFYKVQDIFETRHDYLNYVYTDVYSESNDPKEVLTKVSNVVKDDFSELRGKYEEFQNAYNSIKENGSKGDYKDIVNKYYDMFSHDKVFAQDKNLVEAFTESNKEIPKVGDYTDNKKDNKSILYIFAGIILLTALGLIILKIRKK